MIKLRLILSSIISFVASILCTDVLAFPELVYKGYPSCQGCHVSPSGGGILTQYGRTFAAETLSTWGEAREPLFPKWFNMGGDARHAYTKRDGKEASFPMAMNMTLDIQPIKGIHAVAQIGLYGRDKRTESHQAYLMGSYKLTKKETLNLRVGKFMPNYGIMTPDHTRAIRRFHLISRDNETLNAEGSIISRLGSIFITGIFGETDLKENYGLSYKEAFKAKQGYSARAEAYLSKSAKLAYSVMEIQEGLDEKHSHAIDLTAGLGGSAYYWGEWDYNRNAVYQSHEFGLEAVSGLLLYAGLDRLPDDKNEVLGGIRWFPYPHFELQAEWKDSDFLGQLHYYF